MLQLRPSCECCDAPLPPASTEALICSFECTYCKACAENKLNHICPNCSGTLVPRPVRPANLLEKYPASTERVFNPERCAAQG